MTDFPFEQSVLLMPQFCFFILSKKEEGSEITVKVAQVPNQNMLKLRRIEQA